MGAQKINDWQARSMMRCGTPVVERLYPQCGEQKIDQDTRAANNMPHASTSRGSTARASTARGSRARGSAALGSTARASTTEPQKQKHSKTAFERLTTPRAQAVFSDLPYLPWMKETVPSLACLGLGVPDTSGINGTLAESLEKLEKEEKIQGWQAKALLRCAVPVFDRLYRTSPGVQVASRGSTRSELQCLLIYM